MTLIDIPKRGRPALAEPARAQVDIRLSGPLLVQVEGRAQQRKLTGPVRRLFCYLVSYPGRVHRREALREELWEDANRLSASAFSTVLWRLRKIIDTWPGLSVDACAETVVCHLGPEVSVDRHQLSAALAGSEDFALEHACAQWSAPFLEGDTAAWILTERNRAEADWLAALFHLMRAAGEREDYATALAYGRRILEADPFRESVHAEVMWLLVLTGQRAHAITRHLAFRGLLKRELGIAPMADTNALFEHIRDGLDATAQVATRPNEAPPRRACQQSLSQFIAATEAARGELYRSLCAAHLSA